MPGIRFDPLSRELRSDPYPTYAALRCEEPVHWCGLGEGFWVVTRHAEVAACLRDRRLGMGSYWDAQEQRLGDGPAFALSRTWMLFKDPPDHTRLRGLVSKVFTPRAIEGLRASVERTVDELVGQLARRERFDLMRELALPLPVYVIADLLGVPRSERDRFHEWTQALNLAFEPVLTPEQIARCNEAAGALHDYFVALAAERRRAPQRDLLSALCAAEEAGDRLSELELAGNAALLLSAGYETTMGLLGNGALALLRHPEQLTRLRAEPGLVPNAVEEFMRFDSPVQYTLRFALEPLELAGTKLEAGQCLYLIVGSANRDEARFPAADRLDVARVDVEHLSFGGGRHFCLGAALARMEAEIAFRALLPLLEGASLAEPPVWRDSYLNHAPERLNVRTGPRR